MSFSAVAYKTPPRPTSPTALYPGIVESIIEGMARFKIVEYTGEKDGQKSRVLLLLGSRMCQHNCYPECYRGVLVSSRM